MRYVIADPEQGNGWDHIFLEESDSGRIVQRERDVRFVFDRQTEEVVYMDVFRGHNYQASDREEREDLAQSLLEANPEAIEDANENGLIASDTLPDWATDD